MPNRQCLQCSKDVISKDKRTKFCSLSCAIRYNNKKRQLKESTKQRISQSLKIYYEKNPLTSQEKEKFFWNGIKTSQHKFLSNPQNVYELSSRTRIKILKRLAIGCSRCGWHDDICDIHHIRGRKIPDCHNHSNLTYLCPNCHRLAGNKKISSEELISMETQIGDEWKKHYYG